ncbi:MAG TPA: L,D-transpeptidase family protein [Candidatus Sulfomarinibacteraceae bacterium]|nr:L,D-transpeptidase family protein [Candidatus Sulfomarinibacteraceae bacterium]
MSQHSSSLPESVRRMLQSGRKKEAREFLQKLVREDPQNYRAWLWLAGLSPSPRASLSYIEKAEALNPNDPTVARARAWAEKRLAAAGAGEQPSQAKPSPPAPRPQPPAPATDDVVTQLRERQAAQEPETEPRRGSQLLLALGVLGLFVIVGAIVWTWGDALLALAPWQGSQQELVEAASQPTVGAPAPTAADSSNRFVSGQFAPKLSGSEQATDPAPKETATPTPTTMPLQPKTGNDDAGEPRPTWTMTPSPTNTPTATPTPVPTFVSEETAPTELVVRPAGVGPNERWIDVNLTTQTLVAYEGNTPVFDTLISSGTWQYPTVTGQFRIWLRYTSQTMDGRRLGYDYYLPNVPYVMYFYNDYALHGTYWHNNFGTPMSHGCVNLPTPAAEWIFNWSSMGTLVNVHY